MDTNRHDLRGIFGQDRQHRVPLFQRPYVWNKDDQWEPLWNDVTYVAERILTEKEVRSHFLGAIVLEQVKTPYGHIETREVIDGQQRLITLQLLLEAFSDYCRSKSANKHHEALLKLTRNTDPMSSAPEEQYKVWPTNVDREHFRRVMDCESPEELRNLYGAKPDAAAVGHPLADGYLYFHTAIGEWLNGASNFDARLEAVFNTIRSHLRMIVIDLQSDDDPQLIFETLNARGTPLLPSDLIKNLLFHKARLQGEDLDLVYPSTWKPFDDEGAYWREQIGRGNTRRARIDIFLQHYLTTKIRDDVAVPHLYAQFRAHVQSAGSTRQVLTDVRQHADVYRGFDQMPDGSRAQLFFERIAVLDMTSAYPFLLMLYTERSKRNAEIEKTLVDLESFLVRRLICQMTTKGYGKLFVDLIRSFELAAPDWHAKVRAFLTSGDAEVNRWPDDDELERAWMAIPATRKLTVKRVRMVLEALENQLRTDKTEKITLTDKLTIEHLMPKSWDAHWPLTVTAGQTTGETTAARNERIHTFGNLTLLTGKLNPAVSNGPWDKKRSKIAAHSALALNRALGDFEDWDDRTIQKRGKALFKLAAKVWPHPGP